MGELSKIRCISLHQFYATGMERGLKANETRDWKTDYRGLLGIHAAQTTKYLRDWPHNVPAPLVGRFAEVGIIGPKSFPLGALLCVVELFDIAPTDNLGPLLCQNDWVEWMLGDYKPGRFAWQTRNLRRLREPIPMKGHQGFWTIDMPDESLFQPPPL